jgi:hypothetical protein
MIKSVSVHEKEKGKLYIIESFHCLEAMSQLSFSGFNRRILIFNMLIKQDFFFRSHCQDANIK